MNDQYFLEKGFQKRGDDIYVYENFISKDELNILIPIFDKIRINSEYDPFSIGTHFEKRVSRPIEEMSFLAFRIKDLFEDKYIVRPHTSINILSTGDHWLPHYDSMDFIQMRKNAKTLKEGDAYRIVDDSHYGIVAYFNTVESGGELVYLKQNIAYSPNPGDLVVHSAEENCTHQVNEVLKGHRYSYSNNLRVELKVPE